MTTNRRIESLGGKTGKPIYEQNRVENGGIVPLPKDQRHINNPDQKDGRYVGPMTVPPFKMPAAPPQAARGEPAKAKPNEAARIAGMRAIVEEAMNDTAILEELYEDVVTFGEDDPKKADPEVVNLYEMLRDMVKLRKKFIALNDKGPDLVDLGYGTIRVELAGDRLRESYNNLEEMLCEFENVFEDAMREASEVVVPSQGNALAARDAKSLVKP